MNANNTFIYIAIFQSMLECQLLNDGTSENFAPKLVAMATFFKGWRKQGPIYNLQPNTYCLVKRS